MNISRQEYSRLVSERAKRSPMGKDCLWAFLVGGGICTVGELLRELYLNLGLEEDVAGGLVSVTLIGVTALLTGLGIFDRLARHAGAGTMIPITGFANAVVAPALEFRSEGFITGMAAKMFTVAGPVLTYGISASVIYGIILWLLGR